jgi:DNA-binding transcriptional LysR family regulator
MAGLGFAVMPRALVETDLVAGRLTALPCPGPPILQAFTAARREGVHTPAVELLWQHLREVAIGD